nr:hypothetical protein [Synechococcus sp. CBW1006]
MSNRGHHAPPAPASNGGGTHLQASSQSLQASSFQLLCILHQIGNLLSLNLGIGGVIDSQLPSGIRRISTPLSVRLYLPRVGSSRRDDPEATLPLDIEDNNELLLDLSVETNPIFAVLKPSIAFSEGLGVGEGLRREPEVETTILEGSLAFVVIPLKLEWK